MINKAYKIILFISAILALIIVILNTYLFDPVIPPSSDRHSFIALSKSFLNYFFLFSLLFSAIYWVINKIKEIVKKLP